MRLDLFLKRVGLVKQRTLAKQLCDMGRVELNGRRAKPGKEIKLGDVIRLNLRSELLEFRILEIPQRNFKRTEGAQFYDLLRREYESPFL